MGILNLLLWSNPDVDMELGESVKAFHSKQQA